MIQVGAYMLYKCILSNYAPVLIFTETQVLTYELFDLVLLDFDLGLKL